MREIWQQLYFGKAHWIGRAGATTMAQSAVDIALWDIIAKAAEPAALASCWAARAQADIPIYNTHAGWLNYSIEQLKDEALRLLDQGYTALKMKVGLAGPRARIVVACAPCARPSATDVVLMVDANQKWDLMQATPGRASCWRISISSWLEEPLHPGRHPRHTVRSASARRFPIALGEHVYTTHAFRDYMSKTPSTSCRSMSAASAASRPGSRSRPGERTRACASVRMPAT